MKKIFLFVTVVACVVLGSYNIMCSSSHKVDFLSKLMLDGVEALADDESYCKSMPGSNIGKCKAIVEQGGAACVAAAWYETPDCFE